MKQFIFYLILLIKVSSPCIMCVQYIGGGGGGGGLVHQGMFSTSGDGMSTSGGVQYIGDTMSTSGGISSVHLYIGGCKYIRGKWGYHEYTGGYSLHWEDT